MLLLIALPVLVLVATGHRWLHSYAPTNLVISRARLAPPRWRTVLLLGAIGIILLLAVRVIEVWVAAGAPSWLNLVVLVLAWDTIKFGLASCFVAFGCVRELAVAAASSRRPSQNGGTCA
jgi:hypothetical protein